MKLLGAIILLYLSHFYRASVLLLLLYPAYVLSQVEDSLLPDYYDESGVSSGRAYGDELPNERIDFFSGALQRNYVDLHVPGNAGLDIIVQRYYRSAVAQPGIVGAQVLRDQTVLGEGWDMHFGRIIPQDGLNGIGRLWCRTNNVRSGKNPVLILPDGSSQELLNDDVSPVGDNITEGLWTGTCDSGTFEAVSPEGLRYIFGLKQNHGGESKFHATKIQDKFGNSLTINYHTNTPQTLISSITSSDGRSVTFHYDSISSFYAKLEEIKLNNTSKVTYDYKPISGFTGAPAYLESATRRDEGGSWDYTYYETRPSNDLWGLHSLKQVISPQSLKTIYEYNGVQFASGTVSAKASTVVSKKTASGGGVNSGSWTYDYSPATSTRDYDLTTVKSENFCTKYRHRGANRPSNGTVGLIGTLQRIESYNTSSCGSLVETKEFSWVIVKLSNQDQAHLRYPNFDSFSGRAVLAGEIITRDGASYTTSYSGFDKYGNPQTIVETGPLGHRKTTTNRYVNFDDSDTWVVGLLDTSKVSVSGQSTIEIVDRDYYTSGSVKGALEAESAYERSPKEYTYYTSGSNLGALRYLDDELGNRTTFSSYYRGVPRSESRPEGVIISRGVNSTGTIASETNGEGARTNYTYDQFNRLKSITTPKTNDSNVSITWSSGGRVQTVTRGAYVFKVTRDAYGNVTEELSENIRKRFSYNEEGYLLTESYPTTSSSSFPGVTYKRDVLGRTTEVKHSDGTTADYDYTVTSYKNAVSISDELNKRSIYQYKSFGDPDSKTISRIISPESITTTFNSDAVGNITSISQGGKTRTYNLSSKRLLDYEVHPETGITQITQNDIGNTTYRKVGSAPATTYSFDDLHRLEKINYPTGTEDVDFIYDDNNNVKNLNTASTRWSYAYDSNENLESETLSVLGQTYTIQYDYDQRDSLKTITYPNGLVVELDPDDLGRPQRVGEFIIDIDYHPNGSTKMLEYGNGVRTTMTLDNRQRPDLLKSDDFLSLDYGYDAVGNVKTIADKINSSNTISLTYDDVHRLVSARGPWGLGTLDYTTTGDLDFKNIGGLNLNHTYSSSTGRLSSVSGSLNRSYSYDSYGNVIANGIDTFDYNDAGQLTDVISDGIKFKYDGNNRRTLKYVNNLPSMLYIYNRAGQLLFEKNLITRTSTTYVYLNGNLVAKQSNQNFSACPGNSVWVGSSCQLLDDTIPATVLACSSIDEYMPGAFYSKKSRETPSDCIWIARTWADDCASGWVNKNWDHYDFTTCSRTVYKPDLCPTNYVYKGSSLCVRTVMREACPPGTAFEPILGFCLTRDACPTSSVIAAGLSFEQVRVSATAQQCLYNAWGYNPCPNGWATTSVSGGEDEDKEYSCNLTIVPDFL